MDSVRIQLLGPIALTVGRRVVDVGSPRQRVVLAVLALNVNRVAAVDELVDALWGGSPPSTARGQIHVCISHLRKLFNQAGAPDIIQTRPPGYLLEVAPDQVDVEHFTHVVAVAGKHAEAGRIADASSTLHEALRLWHGPALAGVRSDLVQRSAVLLEEARVAALERRIALDLELSLHQQIVGELQSLCAEHPVREEFHRLLMLALYRCGRQAEALAVGRDLRRFLIEEAGIDPGTDLRDLERAILNQDPVLDPVVAQSRLITPVGSASPVLLSPPQLAGLDGSPDDSGNGHQVPHLLPASVADFTGRGAEIARIENRLTVGQDPYAVRIVAVCGRAGVGKSCLAVRVAHRLTETFPDGLLYANLASGDADSSAPRLLTRFLRALGVDESATPDDVTEKIELYRSRLANKRILLLLDNVEAEQQVLPLLPGSPTCAVIVTCRLKLGGLSGWHRADVGPFDLDESMELLSKIVGKDRVAAEPEEAARLAELCGGLPLALRIAGARLASRQQWRIGKFVRRLADEGRRLDEFIHQGRALRSTIDSAYRALTGQAQRLIRLCAVLPGPDFPGWNAAALLNASPREADRLLESLMDAQMLDTVEYSETAFPHYRLHDLTRLYAREQLQRAEGPQERLAALERVLRAWLALVGQCERETRDGHPPDTGGDRPCLWAQGATASLVEADAVLWAPHERRSLIAIIRLATDAGLAELGWDLAVASASVFEQRGHLDEWHEVTRLALAAAESAGAAEVPGRSS